MRTDELIVTLARSVRPITPVRPPAVRAIRWFAAAALIMIVAIVVIGPRVDLASAFSRPVFLGSFAALLLMLVTGASAAFVLSIPGAERSPAQHILPLLTAAGWSALWLVVFAVEGAAAARTAPFHWACAIEIGVCALAGGWLLLAMVARAAPLRLLWTAAVASLASMATGALVAQILCPLDDSRHQLVGHVLVALVVAGAGLLAGRQKLKTWHRP